MSDHLNCPVCDRPETLEGTLMVVGDEGNATRFYPKGLKFWSFSRSVKLANGQLFRACTKCGHVWSKLDPRDLRDLLAKHA